MTERRRGERYRLAEPGMGNFRVVQDVEITYLDAQSAVVVVVGGGIPPGERLLLDIPVDHGCAPCTRLVLAVDHVVRLDDDALCREVRLKILAREGETDSPIGGPAVVAEAAAGRPVIGAVIRRVPVRLLEVSVSGCLWETPVPLDAGTVGFVEMQSARGRHSEAVRLRSSSRSAGTVWQYRSAGEFLTLGPPSADSLRGVATVIAARIPQAGDC
jgi:hypothetical protein